MTHPTNHDALLRAHENGYAEGLADKHDAASARTTQAISQNFADWLAQEMPPGTVIGNTESWAPRILRAALRCGAPANANEDVSPIPANE